MPVLNATPRLPKFQAVSELTNTLQSPSIDRGDAALAFANEPAPNGAFINQRGHGNTTQAPKASIRGVLDTYDVDLGDTTFVDTGTYTSISLN